MSTQYLEQSRPQEEQAPTHGLRTMLLDNEEVTVISGKYPPGSSEPMHTHSFPSVAYVIEGGTLEITTPEGTVERYEMRPEETLWSPMPHAHSVRNIGSTTVRIVEIEVKHALGRDEFELPVCRS